jgi:hypothetical protein
MNINLKRIVNYIYYHDLGSPEIGTFSKLFENEHYCQIAFRAFSREQKPQFFRLRRAVPTCISLSLTDDN